MDPDPPQTSKDGESDSWLSKKWRPPPPRPVANAFLGPFVLFLILQSLTHYGPKSVENWDNGSFGAAAVIVFAIPHSTAAMPRHIFVGQILSALIAFAYGYAIQSSDLVWLRTALAVGTSAGAMKIVGVSYPPGGATAYILSHLPITTWSTGQLFFYLLFPLTVGSIILVVLGVLLNNRVLGQKYPDAWI